MSDDAPMSKFSLLFGEVDTTMASLPEQFKWSENDDGTWTFDNGKLHGRGHFVVCAYSGAHGEATPADHGLRIGDALAMQGGRCWRVKASRIHSQFDCWGIAMGWYEESDGAFVQVDGVVRGIGQKWKAGGRVYLPFHGYGLPQQGRRHATAFPIGIALNATDLLIVPRLDS